MSDSSRNAPVLDLAQIRFPSDAITVKAVRDALNPKDLFDTRTENVFEGLEACVMTERDIARKAFDAALRGIKPNRIGKVDHESAWERREWVNGIDYDYRRFGVSSGPRQTAELIRDVEAQAAAQAKEFIGKGK